jgi:hypothetical protein
VVGDHEREREKVAMEKKGGNGSLEPLAEVNPVSSSVLLSHSTPEQKDGHGNSINDETGGGAYV